MEKNLHFMLGGWQVKVWEKQNKNVNQEKVILEIPNKGCWTVTE